MHHFPNLHPGQKSYNWRFWIKACFFFFDRRQWGIKENPVGLECLVYYHNSETYQLLDMKPMSLGFWFVSLLLPTRPSQSVQNDTLIMTSGWFWLSAETLLELLSEVLLPTRVLGLNQFKLSEARQEIQANLSWGPFCSRVEWEQTTGSLTWSLFKEGELVPYVGIRVGVYVGVKLEGWLRWFAQQFVALCAGGMHSTLLLLQALQMWQFRDFPGGAVAKTLCSQYSGPRFDPWLGN